MPSQGQSKDVAEDFIDPAPTLALAIGFLHPFTLYWSA
jgi:hypothetical protein